MADVTHFLSAIEAGGLAAAAEMQRLRPTRSRARASRQLPPVREADLRMIGSGQPQNWNSRGHCFAATAAAMCHIIINRARDRHRLTLGGGRSWVALHALAEPASSRLPDILELRRKGHGVAAIGGQLGLSRTAVRQAFRNHHAKQ